MFKFQDIEFDNTMVNTVFTKILEECILSNKIVIRGFGVFRMYKNRYNKLRIKFKPSKHIFPRLCKDEFIIDNIQFKPTKNIIVEDKYE